MIDSSQAGEVPLVVIHGVGSQKPGASALDLARTVSKALRTQQEDVTISAVDCITHFDNSDKALPHDGGVSSRCFVAANHRRRYAIYDFHWAHYSEATRSEVTRLRSLLLVLWRFPQLAELTLPRGTNSDAPRCILKCFVFGTYWLLVIRAVLSLVSGVITYPKPNDLLFAPDLVIAIALLVTVAVATVHSCLGRNAASLRTVFLILPPAVLLFGVLPAAIKLAFDPANAVVANESSASSVFQFDAIDAPSGMVTADWFYAVNTLSGMVFFLSLLLTLVIGIAIAARYLWIWTWSKTASDETLREHLDLVSSVESWAIRFWVFVGALLIVISPVLMLFDVAWLLFFTTLPPTYFPSASPITEVTKVAFPWLLIGCAFAVLFLLTSSALRPLSDAALEFIVDALCYFRGQGNESAEMSRGIDQELGTLLQTIERKHKVPAVVVAHSLGSIIAIRAIAKGNRVHALITMGSPLVILQGIFPDVVKSWRIACGDQNIRWCNFYFFCDNIGRELAPVVKGVEDHFLGAGGHTDYFRSSRVAAKLVESIWERGKTETNET